MHRSTSPIRAMLCGMAMHVIILATVFLIFSAICFSMADPTPYTAIFSLAALVSSAAISGYAVSKTNKEGSLFHSLLCAFPISATLIILSLTVKGGAPISSLINALIYIASALLFSSVAKRRAKKRRRKRRMR